MLNLFASKKKADPGDVTGVAALVAAKMADLAARPLPEGVPLLSLSGKALGSHEFGSAAGVLPAVIWHANRLAAYGMDRKSGLEPAFPPDKQSLLGYRVDLGGSSVPESELLLFMMESVHQTFAGLDRDPANGLTIRLDGLVAEFVSAMAVEQPAPGTAVRPAARG